MGPWILMRSSRDLTMEMVTFSSVPWRCRCCCWFMRNKRNRRYWGVWSFVRWWLQTGFVWWCTFLVFLWKPGLLAFRLSLFRKIYLLVQLLLGNYLAGQQSRSIPLGPGDIDLTVGTSTQSLVHINYKFLVNDFAVLRLYLLRIFWLHH